MFNRPLSVNSWFRPLFITLTFTTLVTGCSEPPEAPESREPHPEAVIPSPRTTEYDWMSIKRWGAMHSEDVAIAHEQDVELLFIGDSITEGWPEKIWNEYFGDYQAANFGIGGDKTENLLWRLNNGAVGTLDPEVVSLLIGVNNFGLSDHEPDDVFQGVEAVVNVLLGAFPNAEILVHGVFPHKESAEDPARVQVSQLNRQIETLAQHERVTYLDIGDQLVDENGNISADIMPDYLHLSEDGYRIWADNLQPILRNWLD